MSEVLSPEKLALVKAAKAVGSQAALADRLGFKGRQSVSPWFTTDRPVPAEKCPDIERATREMAKLKGDPKLIVTCEELRPDIDWHVVRLPRPKPTPEPTETAKA